MDNRFSPRKAERLFSFFARNIFYFVTIGRHNYEKK